MNFVPVQPRRQRRQSGWRLWLLLAWRWTVTVSLLAATVAVTVRWAIQPEVPGRAVPVVAGLNLPLVAAAAIPRGGMG